MRDWWCGCQWSELHTPGFIRGTLHGLQAEIDVIWVECWQVAEAAGHPDLAKLLITWAARQD